VADRRRRPQLSDEAAAYVRELIMSGQLRPGAFIRQDRVADELEMSATPVREGLLALRGEGFVHLEPRRGFVVAPLSEQDIRDMFFAQGVLAGELAARAARSATAEDIEVLVRLQRELDEAASTGALDELERLNHRFHRQINLSAAAPKLAWLLGVAGRYAPRRFFYMIGGWADASVEDHSDILAALKGRDADAASDAMRHHFAHAGELLAKHFAQVDTASTSPDGIRTASGEPAA
jgi:DNA-binding GntR family transcriptional regulator